MCMFIKCGHMVFPGGTCELKGSLCQACSCEQSHMATHMKNKNIAVTGKNSLSWKRLYYTILELYCNKVRRRVFHVDGGEEMSLSVCQTGAGGGSLERSRRSWEGWQHTDDGMAAVESTETMLRRSQPSMLQSDSVWLSVTSEGCLMSQVKGHMIDMMT